jgi:hypothetical protein
LYAANGTTIPTYGSTPQRGLGLRRDFTWRFVIAHVQLLIIGVDLLSRYGLLVDYRNNRLLDGVTSLSTLGRVAPPSVPSVKVIAKGTPPDSLLEKFPELTKPPGSHREARHYTTHHIRTTPGPPVACRPRLLDRDFKRTDWANFQTHLEDRIPTDPELHDGMAIDTCVENFSGAVLEALAASTPKRRPRADPRPPVPAGIQDEIA